MAEPTPEVIKELKAKYPDRSLHMVEVVDGKRNEVGVIVNPETVYCFVMTGPSRDEHKKFIDEMMAAKEMKDEAEKISGVRGAIERAALAQIRWPDRPEVLKLFEYHPEMINSLSATLQEHAGANIEYRSKKL